MIFIEISVKGDRSWDVLPLLDNTMQRWGDNSLLQTIESKTSSTENLLKRHSISIQSNSLLLLYI